jgi:hypothetical protein
MLLFWKIRYLDSRDKHFYDRSLWLNTDTLDPVTKAAVEATYAMCDSSRRAMLRYRALFCEECPDEPLYPHFAGFCLADYFEDEVGQELDLKRMAVTLTDNPDALLFPPGTKQHYIDFCVAEKPAIDLSDITLTPDQLSTLGYFTRDLRELVASSLCKDGPGSLSGPVGDTYWLKTALSDEEIRSFVTIFRRLYMMNEPANFQKAVAAFAIALTEHPIAKLVQAIETEYCDSLERAPETCVMFGRKNLPFTRKRLIDVYINTQYAHQPKADRIRQFNECLTAVGGNRIALTWLFLTEIWKCAIEFQNAGRIIADFYDRYCESRKIVPGVLNSLRDDHHGFGALEKKADQEARILREKATELASVLWERAGRPSGGPSEWIQQALDQLRAATGRV